MNKAKIYAVLDNGEYIGSWTPEVAQLVIGIPKYRVHTYAENKLVYHGRYSFELESTGTRREYNDKLENDLRLTARFLLLASEAGWKRGS